MSAKRKYAFLDSEEVEAKLLKFKSERLSVVKFFLPGIHCSSCIYLLEHLPRLDEGVLRAEVNFLKREITISYDHTVRSLKDISVLLSQLGYPPELSLDSLDQTKKHVRKSDIGKKIAVAGFCFGNTMLMSMPEYLDSTLQLTTEFKTLFHWISLVLTLPVLFYAASDYFVKAWKGLRFSNLNIDLPISLGIVTLFARTAFEVVSGTGMGYADSMTGLVFFLLIGKWYQGKTYQALSFDRGFASYFPVSVTCEVDGTEQQKQLSELQAGDVVILHNDELIPADGTVLDGNGNIDYSFVTGESAPEAKHAGQAVFAGGRQQGGELKVALKKSVDTSELTQLWNAEVFKKEQKNLTTWVDRISKYFTGTILLLALATGVYWWTMDAQQVWNAVSAVLIVACPCALALVLPFAYGHAMRRLGKLGLYLKNAEVIETLSRIQSIVFDKTGTLTSNLAGITYQGDPIQDRDLQALKTALGNSAHPLSRMIHAELPEVEKLSMASFTETTGEGFNADVEGTEVQVGAAHYLGVPKVAGPTHQTRVYVRVGDATGNFAINAQYRAGIFGMLDEVRAQYKTVLLSGDNAAEKTPPGPLFPGAALPAATHGQTFLPPGRLPGTADDRGWTQRCRRFETSRGRHCCIGGHPSVFTCL